MIICNNMKEVIAAQKSEVVTIGFSLKDVGGLHQGHEYLIEETKKRYPNKMLVAAVWSDDWRGENYPLEFELTPAPFNKDYMVDWFKDRVDMIAFIDKEAQADLFSSVDLESLNAWVDNVFNRNKYSANNNGLDCYIKWAMLIVKVYEEVGFNRKYVALSRKDGWYSHVMKHFQENYIDSIQEVFMIDPLEVNGIPYSTHFNAFAIDKTKINGIQVRENNRLFGNKVLVEYYLDGACVVRVRRRDEINNNL